MGKGIHFPLLMPRGGGEDLRVEFVGVLSPSLVQWRERESCFLIYESFCEVLRDGKGKALFVFWWLKYHYEVSSKSNLFFINHKITESKSDLNWNEKRLRYLLLGYFSIFHLGPPPFLQRGHVAAGNADGIGNEPGPAGALLRIRVQHASIPLVSGQGAEQGDGADVGVEADGVDEDADEDLLVRAGVHDAHIALQRHRGRFDHRLVDGTDDGEDVVNFVARRVRAREGLQGAELEGPFDGE